MTGFVDFTNMVCIQATIENALSDFVGYRKAMKTFYHKTGPRQKAKEIMDDTGGLPAITEYPTEVKAPDGQWTEIENVIKIGVILEVNANQNRSTPGQSEYQVSMQSPAHTDEPGAVSHNGESPFVLLCSISLEFT